MFLPDQACAGSLAKPHVVQLCRCPHISPARAGLSSPAAHPLSQRNAGPVNPELGISRVARKLCTTLAALAVDESPLSPTHSIDLEHIAEGTAGELWSLISPLCRSLGYWSTSLPFLQLASLQLYHCQHGSMQLARRRLLHP